MVQSADDGVETAASMRTGLSVLPTAPLVTTVHAKHHCSHHRHWMHMAAHNGVAAAVSARTVAVE